MQNSNLPSYPRHLIQDRLYSHNLRSTTTTLCQPSTTTTFAKCIYRCSAPAAWNSLPKSVINMTVTMFKCKRETFLSSYSFSLPSSQAHCLAPAPLKLWPYGAIQICLWLFYIIIIKNHISVTSQIWGVLWCVDILTVCVCVNGFSSVDFCWLGPKRDTVSWLWRQICCH